MAVSFDARSLTNILNSKLRFFIRRKVPAIAPSELYLYVNAPVSSVVAKAEVLSLSKIDVDDAVIILDSLHMTEDAVRRYIGDRSQVGLYHIGEPSPFKSPVRTEAIQRELVFHPPQNFCAVNDRVAELIELIGSGQER